MSLLSVGNTENPCASRIIHRFSASERITVFIGEIELATINSDIA